MGEPLPQAELLSHVPEGGHRLVLSPSEGGPGAAVTGSAHGPAVPMETLGCPATTLATADVRRPTPVPVGVLGRELGARPEWWLVRGWCEVGRGCMCMLVVVCLCMCVLMCEQPT